MLSLLLASALTSTSCTATDGDTIRCRWPSARPERIRLLGIDAPELPGHCRRGRRCASGDAAASTRSLQVMLQSGSLSIRRAGIDRYGRTLATVSVNGRDLSCWQLTHRMAIYRGDWDNGGRVIARCRGAAANR